MSKVIKGDFNKGKCTVNHIIDNMNENKEDIEDIVIIYTTKKDCVTSCGWSNQSLKNVVFAKEMLKRAIGEMLDEELIDR